VCDTLALLSRRVLSAAPPPLAHRRLARAPPLPPALRRAAGAPSPWARAFSLRPACCAAPRDVLDVRDARTVRRPLIAVPMGKQRRDAGAGAAGPGGAAVPVHTSAHVQLLGLGLDDAGTSSSVLLFFDKGRYLFNAGEGFQARARTRCSALRALRAAPRMPHAGRV
jgi:hypothetical protein